jgi:hypothetical protein
VSEEEEMSSVGHRVLRSSAVSRPSTPPPSISHQHSDSEGGRGRESRTYKDKDKDKDKGDDENENEAAGKKSQRKTVSSREYNGDKEKGWK